MAAKVPVEKTGNFFTKKVGPAPMWVWVAGGVVALYAFEAWRNKKNASQNTDTSQTSDTNPPDSSYRDRTYDNGGTYDTGGSAAGDNSGDASTGNTYDIGDYVAAGGIGTENNTYNNTTVSRSGTPVKRPVHKPKKTSSPNVPTHGRTVQRAAGHAPAPHTQASQRTRTQPKRPVVRPK